MKIILNGQEKPLAAPLRVTVNGEPRELPAGTTVATLLAQLAPHGRPCAVEVNREIVPRSRHGELELKDNDRVEVVFAIGGGGAHGCNR